MALVGSYVALSKPLVAVFPVMLLAWLRFGIGPLARAHWLPPPASEAPPDGPPRRLPFLPSFLGPSIVSGLISVVGGGFGGVQRGGTGGGVGELVEGGREQATGRARCSGKVPSRARRQPALTPTWAAAA